MDLSNYNTNKRKLSKSNEKQENFKRINIENEQSISCFRRCCTRKKYQLIPIQKEKIIKTSSENTNQILKANSPMTHLKRSPFFNESRFCQKISESYDDPCIECCVKFRPDTWENIPKKFNKQLYDNNKSISIERFDTFLNKKTLNSFINDIIGDGVDRMLEIITPMSTDQNKQEKLKIDRQLSINSENNFQENELKKYPSDFEKQNLNKASQIIPDSYNWKSVSNETNFDQQKVSDQKDSLQDQEPYNWDYQDYQWPSPLDPSAKTQLVDKVINDNDSAHSSYSIASVLPSNKRKKVQSRSNLSETKDVVPMISSTHSSQPNYDKLQAKNSSDISSHNNTSRSENRPDPSSVTPHQHETREQNYRSSPTSVSDLFKQITYANKRKSFDLDSVSTSYSIPISVGPSVSSPEVVIDKDDKNYAQSSETTLTEKQLPVSSNTETKQLKNIINMNTKDQTKPVNINLSTKRTQSNLTDTQENQSSSADINDTFNQIRSTMNSWRHLLERLLSFILPSTHDTDHSINLSPSAMTSSTHSWSTLIPSETLNMTQSDSIGPWWGRRDAYDRTPATFIFANESLCASHSIGTITHNKQTCISIENRPCYFKYYSYPNTYHCCCNPSITISNSSSSS